MAVPVKAELEASLAALGARLRACASRGMDRRRQALRAASRALPSPDQLLALPRRRFDEATSRLSRALVVNTERKRARLGAVRLSPAVLGRRVSEGRRQVRNLSDRLLAALRAEVRDRRTRFERDARRFDPVMLTRRHQTFRDRLGALQKRADRTLEVSLERRFARLVQADRLLSTLSYQAVLDRGFAVVADASGAIVRNAAAIVSGQRLTLTLADGKANAIATGEAASRPQRAKLARKAADPGKQGSLF
jgi:exodeoxyribonuclease VII large subunit